MFPGRALAERHYSAPGRRLRDLRHHGTTRNNQQNDETVIDPIDAFKLNFKAISIRSLNDDRISCSDDCHHRPTSPDLELPPNLKNPL